MRLELRKRQRDWINVKAVLPTQQGVRKLNFWLAWSESEQRFADGRDHKIATEHYPAVLETIRSRIAAGNFDLVPGPC